MIALQVRSSSNISININTIIVWILSTVVVRAYVRTSVGRKFLAANVIQQRYVGGEPAKRDAHDFFRKGHTVTR